jgi:polyisoprenoid-binding protein YceI
LTRTAPLDDDRDSLHVRGATRMVLLALAAALIALAAPSMAAAADYNVNTTDDHPDKACD